MFYCVVTDEVDRIAKTAVTIHRLIVPIVEIADLSQDVAFHERHVHLFESRDH